MLFSKEKVPMVKPMVKTKARHSEMVVLFVLQSQAQDKHQKTADCVCVLRIA